MATRFDVSVAACMAHAAPANGCRPALRSVAGRIARATLACIVAFAVTACGSERTYTAEPIAARIVDADTGTPVEGVNVVAAWQAKGGLEGGNIMGYVMVMEDVTNANGEFSFPGWGPKKWSNGAIRDGAPLLILFKPGYDAALLWESKYGVEFAPSHLSSSWNGKVIPLSKYTGSPEGFRDQLSGLVTVLDTFIRADGCAWRSVPRFLKAIDGQHKAFLSARTTFALSSLEAMEERADKSCGPLKQYVLEYGQ